MTAAGSLSRALWFFRGVLARPWCYEAGLDTAARRRLDRCDDVERADGVTRIGLCLGRGLTWVSSRTDFDRRGCDGLV